MEKMREKSEENFIIVGRDRESVFIIIFEYFIRGIEKVGWEFSYNGHLGLTLIM